MAASTDVVLQMVDRAYQVEMYEESMRRNIIVCMGTGTGKTHVAKLRIEAELQRTPTKKVWFTAPNVVLAEQQHHLISSQLPMYRMRTLLGYDNVDRWKSQKIWDIALKDMEVIVSTPQVLLDALRHGFVRLEDISLLVIDEAHHAQAGSASAAIMLQHYHKLKPPSILPHVLGLTASIRISHKTASISTLESNLDAICRTPTRSIDEYSRHLHRALIVDLPYVLKQPPFSTMLKTLREIVWGLAMEEDPPYAALQEATGPDSVPKLDKNQKRGVTHTKKELKALLRNAEYLYENVGSWAAEHFVMSCISNWHNGVLRETHLSETPGRIAARVIDEKLRPLRELVYTASITDDCVSEKTKKLIQFLCEEYHEGIAVIVFVERRSTAYALCKLLRAIPQLQDYSVFSFVGLATSRTGSLVEVADRQEQKTAFADFRAGAQNICIATSVAEEGIDIQAVNLVIRYDDPKEFVGYLQSRGRARQQESKFVYFRDLTEGCNKYAKWREFEQELEEEYKRGREQVEILKASDCMKHMDTDEYIVQSTGARLSHDNAVAFLQHFCAVATRGSTPVYILNGQLGISVEARVLLPADVPVKYREATSKRAWPTERSAKRDAAFQAFKALHEARLVTDNLVPFQDEPVLQTQAKHSIELCKIPAELDIWTSSGHSSQHCYRIEVDCGEEKWFSMIMTLPYTLDHALSFHISESPTRVLHVELIPLDKTSTQANPNFRQITRELFEHAFRKGSSAWSSLEDDSSITFSVVPEANGRKLRSEHIRLGEFLEQYDTSLYRQPLLVWEGENPKPHLWYLSHGLRSATKPSKILVRKVKHLQLYSGLKNVSGGEVTQPKEVTFSVDDCLTKGISTIYGPIILLVPTILQVFEAAIRAQRAQQMIFKDIGFQTAELLVPALLAKSAFGTFNYERLEFLGDTLLKYRASLQFYFTCPFDMEGGLTTKVSELVSNSTLTNVVKDLGLAEFITTEPGVQKHWRLPKSTVTPSERAQRKVSSKTLADTIESALAAAYLEGQRVDEGDTFCTRTLKLFFPEHTWHDPLHIVQQIISAPSTQSCTPLVTSIELMFGYRFTRSDLAQQAMTHSSAIAGMLSYDRLEFLGDAILDIILKQKLFAYEDLSPEDMTIHRAALASHTYLAFCALSIFYSRPIKTPETVDNKPTEIAESASDVLFTDLIHFTSPELRDSITASQSKCRDQRDAIMKLLSCGIFPWTLLRTLNAPKVCSDIVESLIAAVYLDSGGSLAECEKIVDKLGINALLHQMARNKAFESRTPAARLREFCAQKHFLLAINDSRRMEDLLFVAEVRIGHSVLGNVAHFTGPEASCRDEARSMAADMALEAITAGRFDENFTAPENLLSSQISNKAGRADSRIDFDDEMNLEYW